MKSGGPDGELGASLRYLSQRYTMPYKEVKGILYFCIMVLKVYEAGLFRLKKWIIYLE
jgi:hypothetical protein